ncbi:MAG: nucleotidyltransferase family protein [Patescibacteria group bacterium]
MPRLQTISDIESLITDDHWMMTILRHVESLSLPDWYIGAGFVRNKIWDALHGYASRTPLNDIDVVYFDPINISEAHDHHLERQLLTLDPTLPWSVKNQARMHSRNGDAPYTDTVDAFSHWPETATCIGVRLINGHVEVKAPLGIEDLLALRVRPNPHFLHKIDVYTKRVQSKNWTILWPKLAIDIPS